MTSIRPPEPTYKTETNYTNGVKDGKSTGWYENGNKEFEIFYDNGIAIDIENKWYKSGIKRSEFDHNIGIKVSWSMNGIKTLEEHYKGEELDGPTTYWYSNGNVSSVRNYKCGDRDGEWIFYYKNGAISDKRFYNGNEGTCSTYSEEGIKTSEGQYLNNSQEGVWTYWRFKEEIARAHFQLREFDFKDDSIVKVLYKNGFIINTTIINNKGRIIKESLFENEDSPFGGDRSLSTTEYYDNGDKLSKIIYKGGYKESFTAWYKNGQKSRQLIYTDRTLDIDFIVHKTHWHENGRKKYKGSFRYGTQLVSELFRWDEDGNKLHSNPR
jgi:antitoxin component YwqK of YwqJK toxin-antitoxin module